MKIIIKLIITLLLFVLTISISNASEDIKYKKNIALNEIFNINLNELKSKLEEEYKSKILFEWNSA
jgi:hypothetical protein